MPGTAQPWKPSGALLDVAGPQHLWPLGGQLGAGVGGGAGAGSQQSLGENPAEPEGAQPQGPFLGTSLLARLTWRELSVLLAAHSGGDVGNPRVQWDIYVKQELRSTQV